jgi:hypothetical protein
MKSSFLLIAVLLIGMRASAQELQLTLNVNMDQLGPSQKEYLADFATKLTAYVIEHRWTDVEFYGDKIPVNMEIFFTSGSESGEFTAQVALESQRRIFEDGRPTQRQSMIFRVMDKSWSFSYLKGQPFYHDQYQFNDVTSFLDFYMNIVLGLDFDSYEALQGSPYYQKAAQIAQRSLSSNRAAEWQGSINQYSRMNLLSELQDPKFESYRSAMYWYYYEGLDFLATEKEEAQKSIARAIEDIGEILRRTNTRSLLLTMWLEVKCRELCEQLQGYPNRGQLMNFLAQADAAHAEVYRQCAF